MRRGGREKEDATREGRFLPQTTRNGSERLKLTACDGHEQRLTFDPIERSHSSIRTPTRSPHRTLRSPPPVPPRTPAPVAQRLGQGRKGYARRLPAVGRGTEVSRPAREPTRGCRTNAGLDARPPPQGHRQGCDTARRGRLHGGQEGCSESRPVRALRWSSCSPSDYCRQLRAQYCRCTVWIYARSIRVSAVGRGEGCPQVCRS